jgi:hypothetical protein
MIPFLSRIGHLYRFKTPKTIAFEPDLPGLPPCHQPDDSLTTSLALCAALRIGHEKKNFGVQHRNWLTKFVHPSQPIGKKRRAQRCARGSP